MAPDFKARRMPGRFLCSTLCEKRRASFFRAYARKKKDLLTDVSFYDIFFFDVFFLLNTLPCGRVFFVLYL